MYLIPGTDVHSPLFEFVSTLDLLVPDLSIGDAIKYKGFYTICLVYQMVVH